MELTSLFLSRSAELKSLPVSVNAPAICFFTFMRSMISTLSSPFTSPNFLVKSASVTVTVKVSVTPLAAFPVDFDFCHFKILGFKNSINCLCNYSITKKIRFVNISIFWYPPLFAVFPAEYKSGKHYQTCRY